MAAPRTMAAPFAIDALGRVAFIEDTEQQIRDQVHMIVSTDLFSRAMRPRYGIELDSYVFGFNDELEATRIRSDIEAALGTWLPTVTVISTELVQADEGTLAVNLSYSIPTTASSDPTVYSAVIKIGGTVVGA